VRLICQGLVSLAALLALAGAGCGSPRLVWFTPDLASEDMAGLFTHPERWPLARSRVDVFKFYAQQLALTPEECPECGPNTFARLAAASAFSRLAEWRVAIGVELPVVKAQSCGADQAVLLLQRAVANLRSQGRSILYLAMDEPYLSGAPCGYDADRTASEVARFVSAVHGQYPGILVGDIEPYPALSADAIQAWIAKLAAAGAAPAFFHLDVDHAFADAHGLDVGPDLAALQRFCAQRALPFGILFSGHDGVDDHGYHDEVLAWTRRVASIIGTPDHSVFQSFTRAAGGGFSVPLNLPEDDPAILSHTRLLLEGTQILRPWPRAGAPGQD